jgi:hypothetical protein
LETLKILATFVNKQKPLLKTLQKKYVLPACRIFLFNKSSFRKRWNILFVPIEEKALLFNARSTSVKTP